MASPMPSSPSLSLNFPDNVLFEGEASYDGLVAFVQLEYVPRPHYGCSVCIRG